MEQKKLLLVAISVGVFFVIVIGSALIFLKPAGMDNAGIAAARYIPPADTSQQTGVFADIIDVIDEPKDNYRTDAPELSYDSEIPTDEEDFPESVTVNVPEADDESKTLITLEPKPTVGVPDDPIIGITGTVRYDSDTNSDIVQNDPPKVSAPAPKTQTPQPQTSKSQTPSIAQKPAPSNPKPSGTTAKPAPAKKTRDDYWVQTGAFSMLSRAENAKKTLADKGIASIIENRNIGDTLYFRVRIGPYISQNEADYWLNLIKSINGFEDSQVRVTQTPL